MSSYDAASVLALAQAVIDAMSGSVPANASCTVVEGMHGLTITVDWNADLRRVIWEYEAEEDRLMLQYDGPRTMEGCCEMWDLLSQDRCAAAADVGRLCRDHASSLMDDLGHWLAHREDR